MSTSIRRIQKHFSTTARKALFQVFSSIFLDIADLVTRTEHCTVQSGAIADGTTAGNLQNGAAVDFRINGQLYTKAATDDLWDLSAETDTIAAQFRAYWLFLNAAGTASFLAGSNAASEALAIAALPVITETESVIGVYAAGVSTDFNDAGGLDAQGTIFDGFAAGRTMDLTNGSETP